MNTRDEKLLPADKLAYIVCFTIMAGSATFGMAYMGFGMLGMTAKLAAFSSIAYLLLGFVVMAIFAVGGRHELSETSNTQI